MKTIKEMLEARGFVVTDSRSTTPRMRVMSQAKSMLAKLHKMKSVDELDSKTSNQNWWMPLAVDGQRRLIMRYGGPLPHFNDRALRSFDAQHAGRAGGNRGGAGQMIWAQTPKICA